MVDHRPTESASEVHRTRTDRKWGLPKEQGRNKRVNVRVRVGREVKTIAEWAELAGLKYHTLWARLRRAGWSSKRAVSTKPRSD